MDNRFWQGIIWGGVAGTLVSMVMNSMMREQKKPLLERGADAITSTTHGLVRKARRARRKMMDNMD